MYNNVQCNMYSNVLHEHVLLLVLPTTKLAERVDNFNWTFIKTPKEIQSKILTRRKYLISYGEKRREAMRGKRSIKTYMNKWIEELSWGSQLEYIFVFERERPNMHTSLIRFVIWLNGNEHDKSGKENLKYLVHADNGTN